MKGIGIKEQDYSAIEAEIKALMRRLVFDPIVALLAPRNAQVRAAKAELRNAKSDPLTAALRSGRVQYDMKDTFSGEFSAAISKVLRGYGAKFNKRTGTFAALPQTLPTEVLEAAQAYGREAVELHVKLMARLDEMEKGLMVGKVRDDAGLQKAARAMVSRTGKDFHEEYGDALGISTTSQGAQDHLAKMYVDSITPPIKDFSIKMVQELRGIVAQNATEGYRFSSLIDRIEDRYKVTPGKAAFLARQETSLFVSKARAERFVDAGVREYIWDTAGDVDVRKGHKELDGKTFNFRTKAQAHYMSCGEPCNPGEDFNCLPGNSPINFAYGIRKGLGRWYTGDLTEFVTASGKTIRCTPNHQVLTSLGWKDAGLLCNGDHVINLSKELAHPLEHNDHEPIPTIGEIVHSINHMVSDGKVPGVLAAVDFNTDLPDRYVHVVRPARRLMVMLYSACREGVKKFLLAHTNAAASAVGHCYRVLLSLFLTESATCGVGVGCQSKSFFGSGLAHPEIHAFAATANMDTCLPEKSVQNDSTDAGSTRNGFHTFSGLIRLYQWLYVNFNSIPWPHAGNASSFKFFTKLISGTAESFGNDVSGHFSPDHFDRIVHVGKSFFSGHVYNLETRNHWYCSNDIILHNCRCVARPIVPAPFNQENKYAQTA